MDPEDSEQTEILRNIWGSVKELGLTLGARIDATNERLDAANERLDAQTEHLERLERRQVETETRLATELTAVVGAVHALRDAIVADRDLRATVDGHERRLLALESKVG